MSGLGVNRIRTEIGWRESEEGWVWEWRGEVVGRG
jgi:hypothetical protein